jgi:hypothetical protein
MWFQDDPIKLLRLAECAAHTYHARSPSIFVKPIQLIR